MARKGHFARVQRAYVRLRIPVTVPKRAIRILSVMEISLRCAVPDRPGALAELAGVIATCGGDIEAVDVVEVTDGIALDDLVVVVSDPAHLRRLLGALAEVDDVEVVHAAPSRGHPGDAVTRFAVGLEAVLNGAMDPERGVTTLLGGLLRADEVEIVSSEDAPDEDAGVLIVPVASGRLVLRRSFAFTDTERGRAAALARVCAEAGRRDLFPRA